MIILNSSIGPKETMTVSSAWQTANGKRQLRGRNRGGYIFLLSVLIIGAVLSATSFTLLLLGLGAELSGLAVRDSLQAYENAETCAERAILALRSDLSYDGNVTLTLPDGTCTLSVIAGNGNDGRGICIEGASGTSVRRIEILLRTVLPKTRVVSWMEVAEFSSLCPT